jgi:hypothetical protein
MLGRAMRPVFLPSTTTRQGTEAQPSVLGSATACQTGSKRTA